MEMPFKPGTSGNPGGRPKQLQAVVQAARQYTELAIATLVAVMKDPKSPGSARIAAAVAILDRGWGKPSQAIEHSGGLDLRGGIDAPPIPETMEEWLARRRVELDEMVKAPLKQ
jgi:hypothetical protein